METITFHPATGPAFVMSDIPFSTMDLQSSEIEAISDIFDRLEKTFSVSYDTNFSYDFDTLEIFQNREVMVGPAIKITNSFQSFDLVFINIGYTYGYVRQYNPSLTYEYQTWGVITLQDDLGHILIKPETLLDKIHELINPIEIDFKEDLEFSKRFFVVTDNESRARSGMNQAFRTVIKKLDVQDYIIEIRQNKLIIGNRKRIDADSAIQFANFMDLISKLR